MRNPLMEFLRDESGNSALQYGVMGTLVSGALVAPMSKVGDQLSNVFLTAAKAMAVH